MQIEAAQTVLVDALQGETFIVRLTTSIDEMWIKNVTPGQLYVFIFTQDRRGRHKVTWGELALNASPVDPAPYSSTVQSFIGNADSSLQTNLVAAWNQPKGGPSWQPPRPPQCR